METESHRLQTQQCPANKGNVTRDWRLTNLHQRSRQRSSSFDQILSGDCTLSELLLLLFYYYYTTLHYTRDLVVTHLEQINIY